MALLDPSLISERLRNLRTELDQKEGRKPSDYDLAREIGIPLRSFQYWQNGEGVNRDGRGYDKIAKFYSRKLGRKITRQWIVTGGGAVPLPEVQQAPLVGPEPTLEGLSAAVEELTRRVEELAAAQAKQDVGRAAGKDTATGSRRTSTRSVHPRKSTDS